MIIWEKKSTNSNNMSKTRDIVSICDRAWNNDAMITRDNTDPSYSRKHSEPPKNPLTYDYHAYHEVMSG